MSARKFLRVELVPTDLSHLVCVGCGSFNVQFAIVVDNDPDYDAHVGVHKKCISRVKAKRGTKS
jgi:hypothetical protein